MKKINWISVLSILLTLIIVASSGYYIYIKNFKLVGLNPVTVKEKPMPTRNPNPKPSTMGEKVNTPVILPKEYKEISCVGIFKTNGDVINYLPFKNEKWQDKAIEKLKSIGVTLESSEERISQICGFVSYANENWDTGEVSITNFDLRTGVEFSLRDVFADNVDAEFELNKYLSMYLLSLNEGKAKNFTGIDMNTRFTIDTEYLKLYFNDGVPLFSGKKVSIPLTSLGNNGDCIAVFNRFPPLEDSELDISRVKQAEIDSAKEKVAKYEKLKEEFGEYYDVPESSPSNVVFWIDTSKDELARAEEITLNQYTSTISFGKFQKNEVKTKDEIDTILNNYRNRYQ